MSIFKLLAVIPFFLLSLQDSLAQSKIHTQELDSLHVLVKQARNTTRKIDGLLGLCRYYRKINTEDLDSLSYYANKILTLIDSQKNLENKKVDALEHLAFVAYYKRENDLAKEYIKEFKGISKKIGYGTGLSNACYHSGYLSLDEGDVNMYIYHLENAYKIAKDYNVPKPVIFKMGIGLSSGYTVYNFNSDLISNVLLDLIGFLESPEISLEDKGVFYLDLGTLYYNTKAYEKAKTCYEKSIQFFKDDNNNPYYLYAPLINLANCYQVAENHEKAVTIFKEALAVSKPDSQGNIYYGLGSSFIYLKDYTKAERDLKKAQAIYKDAKDYRGEGDCLYGIGEIYFEKNAVQQAYSFFDLAIEKYKKSIASNKKNNINKPEIVWVYEKIAAIYKIKNNFKESLAYHKLYALYKDSIASNQNLKQSERYDFIKKIAKTDTEIENLGIENKLQDIHTAKQKNYKVGLLLFSVLILLLLIFAINRYLVKQSAIKIINDKNEQNKLLIREIHHRVKNNLQIISSLLGAKITSHRDEEDIKNILEESQNKIKAMAIIHQNLYTGNQYTTVAVNTYVEELIAQVKRSMMHDFDTVVFDLDIAHVDIQMGLAVPLGLMLNELITNRLTYGFSDQNEEEKKITIGFHEFVNTAEYRLTVKDNGNGLPKDFNIDNLPCFSLQLVHSLVEQLKGTINVTDEKGTCINITFKKGEFY